MKTELPALPKSRPEIWRLAKFLHNAFGEDAWTIADKHGWYQVALKVHNEVYRTSSPYLRQDMPIEATTIRL